MNELKRLAIDLYHNRNLMYNNVSGDQALRNMIAEKLNIKPGDPIDFYTWEAHKMEVFQILSVTLDAILPTVLTNQFDSLADVRNVATGDKPRFEIQDNSLLKVGLVAAGTQDLHRQVLSGSHFTVDTDWYGAKVYVEFEQFLAGNVDWNALVDRVALSFANKMGEQIYKGFSSSYDSLRATRKVTGTYDEDKLVKLAQHISVASGGKRVAVYGTLAALRKVTKGMDLSDAMKDKLAAMGYLGNVAGLDLIVLPQAYISGKEEFAIDDNSLLVLPQGEKVVAVVFEGQTIVNEPDNMNRNDLQKEFVTLKRYGLQVSRLAIYGMYKIS